MRGIIRKLFERKAYDEREELFKAFLSGKLSIAIPIDVEAITILSMFEYCVMKSSDEKDTHDFVAYVNKVIETLTRSPETIECELDMGLGFKNSMRIRRTDVLKSLIRVLEILKNSYLAYIKFLWEAIEWYINNLELNMLQLPLLSRDKLRIALPGIVLNERVKVSIAELVSEQVYTVETTKDFILGSMLGLVKAFLEAVCNLSPKLFEIKVREVKDNLRVHVIKIYGPGEKVDMCLKQYNEIVSNIKDRCSKTSSRIIDILDELITKAKGHLSNNK